MGGSGAGARYDDAMRCDFKRRSSPQRRASEASGRPPCLPDSPRAPTVRRGVRRSVDAALGARSRRRGKINCDPILATRSYIDHFGNRVTRVEVPAGFVVFSNRPDVDMTPIADLPGDVLLFLLQSRYCDSDKLADFAWSNFGIILRGRQRTKRRGLE
jgi:hypothetical protein